MTTRYEVETHLNPRYAETQRPCDYFGIYEVVKHEGDNLTPIKTFEGGEGRMEAYRLASELQLGVKLDDEKSVRKV